MLKTNIVGSVAVVSFMLLFVGYGISLNTEIEWPRYFKTVGAVFAIAACVALITRFLPPSGGRQ